MMFLKLAVQKSGRLHEDSIQLLKDCGIAVKNGYNHLKVSADNFPLEVYFLRDDDIPQYVEDGVADIKWIPLTNNEIKLSSNAGKFEGNDLFVDSSYTAETVKVKAELKSNPAVWREITIYIRKRGFDEPLKTDEEVIEEIKKQKVKTKTKTKND